MFEGTNIINIIVDIGVLHCVSRSQFPLIFPTSSTNNKIGTSGNIKLNNGKSVPLLIRRYKNVFIIMTHHHTHQVMMCCCLYVGTRIQILKNISNVQQSQIGRYLHKISIYSSIVQIKNCDFRKDIVVMQFLVKLLCGLTPRTGRHYVVH